MKKLVFASATILMGLGLVVAPQLKAQDSDKVVIKDPAEYNAYQVASTQTDPKAQASALEGFLTAYPQSVVKKSVLSDLITAYQSAGDLDHALSAASRMLQIDPANIQAIYTSVVIKKGQCGKTSDAQTCDDMGALAQKGLASKKPAELPDADWQKTIRAFHSALALDYLAGKKDVKAAIDEYRTELLLFPLADTTSGPGLVDTLQLAEAYAKPDARDMVQAVWFYARVWNFAPPAYKAQIEPKLEYWYKRYHGKADDADLERVKSAAAKTLFKPDDFIIKPAPTPAEIAHDALTGGDPAKLSLEDREYILANGVKEDADKIWALMKGQTTPVPGIVIEASTTVIKVAVTQDAKDNKKADFIVNLKKPLDEKDVPAAGTEYKLQPANELDATIESFTVTPAVAPNAASAQIVASEGFIQAEKKAKPAAPARKPGAAHHK